MSYPTQKSAVNSLREFSPAVRARHSIIRFWSKYSKPVKTPRVDSPYTQILPRYGRNATK